MRIASIRIRNFKAIRHFDLLDVADTIVIAGPNGSGKSCVFDAIRLLKAAYAGYNQQDEWQQFYSEMQVNLNDPQEIRRLFNDQSAEIRIEIDFQISIEEREYIKNNVERIISEMLFQSRFGHRNRFAAVGEQRNEPQSDESGEIRQWLTSINSQLNDETTMASLVIQPDLEVQVGDSALLSFVFSMYDSKNIGIIDYHSPHRQYQRERIGGINISIDEAENRSAQSALYNWQNKYSNVKSELAAAYIRDLISAKSDQQLDLTPSIISTLSLLFESFLPGKSFSGPKPGTKGTLTFPIYLEGGGEHDIDDLSSGEKELVYGYLRIRNSAPTKSIILLDEPELHLNPRLISGLAEFYRAHIGSALNNQIWMVTHSDAFLRDAYHSQGISLYHMTPASASIRQNQATTLSQLNDVDRAVIDLVGDIAGYKPGSTFIIFESSDTASFDALMTGRLFPEIAKKTNFLSGANKSGVRQLHAALKKAIRQTGLPFKAYAITDRDLDEPESGDAFADRFTWDRYHIENYLLCPTYISRAMQENPTYCRAMLPDEIESELKALASETIESLALHSIHSSIQIQLKASALLRVNPGASDQTAELRRALGRADERFKQILAKHTNENAVETLFEQECRRLREALADGTWVSEFRGRKILRLFAGKHLAGLPYEAFRDNIIARMADAGHQPSGMRAVLDQIS